MTKIKVDTHTHSIFSGHALGTLWENVKCASMAGMEAICMTDHFGAYSYIDKRHNLNFGASLNFAAIPQSIEGVRILTGSEMDIVDLEGHLAGYDTPYEFQQSYNTAEYMLEHLEVVIASLHAFTGYRSGSKLDYTRMYCNVAATPGVCIIGHIDRAGLPFEIDPVLITAKEHGTLIEINEHSVAYACNFADNTNEMTRKIAARCAELEVEVAVGSDAHCPQNVGRFDSALKLLGEIAFPEELIANTTFEKFYKRISLKAKAVR